MKRERLVKPVSRNDPKRLKARAERDKASTRVEILLAGVSKMLDRGYFTDMEELQPILDMMNGDVVEAMKVYEAATEAYRPFMWRRRVRPRKKAAA